MELPTSLTSGDTLVMRPLPELRSRLAFGPFEFDAVAEDLRKHGHRIRLAGQPLQILSALLLQFGEVVSRKILLRQFWAGSKGLEGWDATYPAETVTTSAKSSSYRLGRKSSSESPCAKLSFPSSRAPMEPLNLSPVSPRRR